MGTTTQPGQDITFLAAGEEVPAAARQPTVGTVRQAVRLAATRAAGKPVKLVARAGEDVVRLTLANGPTLVLHPESARDLLASQQRGSTRAAAATAADVQVGAQLAWPGVEATAARDLPSGWMGQATLASIEVIGDVAKNLAMDTAVDRVSDWLVRRIDGQVNPGLYALDEASFERGFKEAGKAAIAALPDEVASAGPLLVLVHGTFVETHSTFGKLWAEHPDKVRSLFQRYGNRVYALDHATVGQSPVRNALDLVAALPAGARLHLLTHSRGGLVAEVLARACSGDVPSRADLERDLPAHAADLEALFTQARHKGLRVERMVRVACPARGTLLASRRLDAYLSVLKWALDLGGVIVLPQLVEFLHGIAARRAEIAEMPGLEAMMPESRFIAWLTGQSDPIEGDLRVIAGDVQGDSVISWVKTLLADAYYWTDNDLVVHTKAMYGGVPRDTRARTGAARFLLDRGGKVVHFNYFRNESTAQAVMDALLQDDPARFAAIGPRSWAGRDTSGTRAALQRSRGAPGAPAGSRPAVFVLPGIMGSNIARGERRIWLDWNFVDALLDLEWSPQTAAQFHADGPVPLVYDALIERLADSHEVHVFAYDWRRPLEDEAVRLAGEIEQALAERSATGQPVRILAHSMGGLLARTLHLERPDTWKRMMQRDGARLLMLGTPHGGSWAPMQTLTGDDGFGNALAAFGSLFHNRKARAVMAGLPGLMQLQAGLNDPVLRLAEQASWQKLVEQDLQALTRYNAWHQPDAQLAVYGWSAPPQDVLARAAALRSRLDAQVPDLHGDAARMAIVVGHDRFTPGGCELTDAGLQYVAAPEGGDGRVPHRSAQLPGVATWKVDAPHGKLPQATEAFAAYLELLATGTTARLETMAPLAGGTATRGAGAARTQAQALVRSRPSRRFEEPAPPESPSDLMDAATGEPGRTTGEALAVAVVNGDLQFIAEPLIVGHYRSLQLTGSERVIDGLVNHAMKASLATGLYPEAVGTQQIFANDRRNPANPLEMARPRAAIVVGLGEEGKLTASALAFSIRQAVLAFAQRLTEQPGSATASFELAATLVGSGGTRITTGTSAQAVAQGVLDANRKLADAGWPRVARLTLVELFLERAAEAWHALRQQQAATSGALLVEPQIDVRDGGKRRPVEAGYRGASYDFISALTQRDAQGNVCIAYDLDTRRARTEVRAQHAQTALVRELVATGSNQANTDEQIGRTLFNLLVPPEIENYLAGTGEMVLEVDAGTAVIPWELLRSNPDPAQVDARPWAVRSRLVRKLRTETFRERVVDAGVDDAALVIGEPAAPPEYPPLEGARAEAQAVVQVLGAQLAPGMVRDLVDHDDAIAVVNALFARSYRIIHVAGHGAPGPDGGVVLSGGTFLGANEVRSMRTVPELVFLNCCHLAARDVQQLGAPQDRAQFAANIAEELIRAGVRCVIAAGWAVEDRPAEVFATSFYTALIAGRMNFMDAVGAARDAAWQANPAGNTWAAYQCYGDPAWAWHPELVTERTPPATEDIASSHGLALALENLRTDIRYAAERGAAAQEDASDTEERRQAQRDRIDQLAAQYQQRWGHLGLVAEGFGLAYAEVMERPKAIAWLQRALAAEDGTASLHAAEQLANVRARHGEKTLDVAAIEAAIQELAALVAAGRSRERLNLLGSAYKRLAMVYWNRQPRDAAQAAAAIAQAGQWYAQAHALATAGGALDAFYPGRNALAAAMAADMMQGHLPLHGGAQDKPARKGGRKPAAAAAKLLEQVVHETGSAAATRPDFWSVVGATELQVLGALGRQSLARDLPGLLAEFADHKERVDARRFWDSVYTEARFLLGLYGALQGVSEDEREAAQALLEVLQKYAGAA